jgi:hypothetical protein
MHTITECPRCKMDFMYHSTDTYLDRTITIVDEVGNNEVVDITICQNCHLGEKWVGKEVKTTNPDYTHLNDFKLVVVSIVDEEFPITVKIGDRDSFEWFNERELKLVIK